jgi:hypothetical protein
MKKIIATLIFVVSFLIAALAIHAGALKVWEHEVQLPKIVMFEEKTAIEAHHEVLAKLLVSVGNATNSCINEAYTSTIFLFKLLCFLGAFVVLLAFLLAASIWRNSIKRNAI